MGFKNIIKESLLNEIGTATSKPYNWRLKDAAQDSAIYKFKTKGGSNLVIEVNFLLISPSQFEDLDILGEISHPYYYWDTEFVVAKYKGEEFWGDDKSMTISSSPYKTDKNEIFRIMATLSEIIKDFMKIHKVRGFAFKPASDSRGKLFMKYFESQLPNAKVQKFEDGATVVTVNDSVEYRKGEDPFYDNQLTPYNDDDTYVKSKLTKKSSYDWTYNDRTGEWERKGVLHKVRRKLGV